MLEIGAGKNRIILEADELDHTQQYVVLDRHNDHGFEEQVLGFTEALVPLQAGMDLRQFVGIVDILDKNRALAERDVPGQ